MKFDPAKEVKINTDDEFLEAITYTVQNHIRTVNFDIARSVKLQQTMDVFKETRSAYFPLTVSYNIDLSYGLTGRMKGVFHVKYTVGKVKFDMMYMEVDKEIERLRKLLFLPGMPAEAKVYLTHNYLTTTAKYVKMTGDVGRSYCHSAYGALIKKECVCQGYADAFARILEKEGIASEIVFGTASSESGELHGWNNVTIGSDTYMLDLTADRGTMAHYERYCTTEDKFISFGYSWNRKYFKACRGGKDVLKIAQDYVRMHKKELLAKGVSSIVLAV